MASTLSLPLRVGDAVVGSVHMYAATADAFAGHVDQLERLPGAAQASAVMNADLTFATRLEALAAPQRLRENLTIDTAVGLIAGIHRISTEEADRSLRDDAAGRGYISSKRHAWWSRPSGGGARHVGRRVQPA